MSFSKVKIGNSSPEIINVVIEIPRGSHHKYEYDEEMHEIKLDRVLHSSVFYPTDYGFIPDTRGDDGDHLDVLVIISEPSFPGCVMEVRPVGVLDMADDKGQDWKIIAVCNSDPRLKEMNSLEDLDEHHKNEIQHFFEVYKQLENKEVEVKGWLDKDRAYRIIIDAQDKHESD